MAITEMTGAGTGRFRRGTVPSQFRGPAPESRSDQDVLGDPRDTAGATAADCWTASWRAWGTTAYVTVTDPAALPVARRIVARQFAAAEKAAARYRRDAEIHKLYRAGGRSVTVSPLLADLVSSALIAAERTGGDVDPTVGAAMTRTHGRDAERSPSERRAAVVPDCGSDPTAARPAPGWETVRLEGHRLQVPPGTTLDLSATVKAVTCDRAAALVHSRLGVGVLVGLGGDAATAGTAPDAGWTVLVGDRTGARDAQVRLPAGAAIATSHLTARGALAPRPELGLPGHLINPRTGRAPDPVWRMATAIAFSSLEAATYTAATLVRGTSARSWLTQLWVPARLVTVYDDVIEVGAWAAHHETSPAAFPPVANPRRTIL